MKSKDRLPTIIAVTALIIYLVFLFVITRSSTEEPLEGGDIQRAIETDQYK
jgi:hypothetical protein